MLAELIALAREVVPPPCERCRRPIGPGEPAYHRNGRPAIHRRCLHEPETGEKRRPHQHRVKPEGRIRPPHYAGLQSPPAPQQDEAIHNDRPSWWWEVKYGRR